jgi:hypothetical protein
MVSGYFYISVLQVGTTQALNKPLEDELACFGCVIVKLLPLGGQNDFA